MLDHLLNRIQSFERRHGISPNVVYINHSHYRVLRHECPGLFSDTVKFNLGFHLILQPDLELPHPRIGWIPPRVQIGPELVHETTATIFPLHAHRYAG